MSNVGQTYVENQRGVTPETFSVVSARNRLYAITSGDDSDGGTQIGVVANFNPSEGRTIEPVRGIGYGDKVMELVPGMTDPMSITITRTAQYLSMIMQVFGYRGGVDGLVRSLRHHKYPFDLRQELIVGALAMDFTSGGSTFNQDGGVSTPTGGSSSIDLTGNPMDLRAVVTWYEACWMSDWSVSFASDTALVQEDVTVNVTDIVAEQLLVYDETVPLINGTDLFNPVAVSKYLTQSSQG
jgi:hypothetical protein